MKFPDNYFNIIHFIPYTGINFGTMMRLPGFAVNIKKRKQNKTINNCFKSIAAVSMHKAGSSIADTIITILLKNKGYNKINFAHESLKSGLSEADYCIDAQNRIKPSNEYYGMFRGPYVKDMPRLKDIRVIIQIRDPRDCITSAYYSFAFSHAVPDQPDKRRDFLSRRERILNASIDEYVISKAGEYRYRMTIIRELMSSHQDILVLKYEDMVEDTEHWLKSLTDFIDLPLEEELATRIKSRAKFDVEEEDPSNHRRQVKPGDHKRKLKPETILKLNEVLRDELEAFGYSEPSSVINNQPVSPLQP